MPPDTDRPKCITIMGNESYPARVVYTSHPLPKGLDLVKARIGVSHCIQHGEDKLNVYFNLDLTWKLVESDVTQVIAQHLGWRPGEFELAYLDASGLPKQPWTCAECNTNNGVQDDECMVCDTLRPTAQGFVEDTPLPGSVKHSTTFDRLDPTVAPTVARLLGNAQFRADLENRGD